MMGEAAAHLKGNLRRPEGSNRDKCGRGLPLSVHRIEPAHSAGSNSAPVLSDREADLQHNRSLNWASNGFVPRQEIDSSPPTQAQGGMSGRRQIFTALTELDAFEIGWRPPPMIDSAPVEHWVVHEADGDDLYVLIGRRAGLLFQAPVLCLDPAEGIARVWDEWLPLDRAAAVPKLPPLKRVTAAGRDWLLSPARGAGA